MLTAFAVVSLAAEMASAAGAAQVSEAPVDRMIALNRRAFADIQGQHFKAARYWLEEALVISETAGLDNDEMTARTYLHLAAVALGALKDRDEALRNLDLALKINPNIALTPGLDIPGLRSAYLQARQQAALPPNPDPTAPNFDPSLPATGSASVDDLPRFDELSDATTSEPFMIQEAQTSVRDAYAIALVKEPDLPARVPVPIYCLVPADLLPGQDLIVRCVTQRQPRKSTAFFHYRPDAQNVPFTDLPMDRTPKGWLVAVVPAAQLGQKSLSYYITAFLPGRDQPLYLAFPEAPRAVAVRTDVVGDSSDHETVAEHGGAADVGGTAAASERRRRTVGSAWLALGLGSGLVYHGRETVDSGAKLQGTDAPAPVKEGFSPAGLMQFEPELGYQLSRRLSVSLMGRLQYAPMAGRQEKGQKAVSTSAFALFVQGRYGFPTVRNMQPFASAGFGVGQTFLAVIDRDCEGGSCSLDHSDTLHGGPVALTAGAGLLYHLGARLGVFAELKEIASLPSVMALTEISVGVAFATQVRRASPESVAVTSSEFRR
jgi:hypothetical protein